jgi:hypothetical protein
MKNTKKPGETSHSDATHAAPAPKVPEAGVGHRAPDPGPYVPGPMGNDPRVTDPKPTPGPDVTGEKTKTPGKHGKHDETPGR